MLTTTDTMAIRRNVSVPASLTLACQPLLSALSALSPGLIQDCRLIRWGTWFKKVFFLECYANLTIYVTILCCGVGKTLTGVFALTTGLGFSKVVLHRGHLGVQDLTLPWSKRFRKHSEQNKCLHGIAFANKTLNITNQNVNIDGWMVYLGRLVYGWL